MKSLKNTIEICKANLIAVVETKAKPPNMEGYINWHAKNRKNNQGGGVAITITEEFKNNTTKLENEANNKQEIVWLEIQQNHKEKICIGTYYGKQESVKEDEIEEEYNHLREELTKIKKKGLIILTGDFNAKLKINKNNRQQQESRNGKYLRELIEYHQLVPISLDAEGTWTREKRTARSEEKSTIDYILVSKELKEQIEEIIVDEEGNYKLKGNKQTDHHTLLLTMNIPIKKKQKKRKIWKKGTKEQWKDYNQELAKKVQETNPKDITEFTKIIQESLKAKIGETIIIEGKARKVKETPEIKQARNKHKLLKKEYEEIIKNKNNNKETVQNALNKKIQAQHSLKEKITQEETKTSTNKLNELIKNNVLTKEFWKTRAKITGKSEQEPYDTITEEGETITSEKRTLEHVADYYEDLFQAREGTEEQKEWTKIIEEKVKQIEREMNTKPSVPKITTTELRKIIKKLKRMKALGPDRIPNEIFIEANEQTLEIYAKYLNIIIETRDIPEIWQEGELMRLYKGKGKIKGKCSSERGITFASNYGKLFERIINERIDDILEITEAQLGGRRGASTTDHLIMMKEMITEAKNNKKPLYMVFLDVEKAYDKAWLDAIMYVLYNNGVKDRHWELIKLLNTNLTARIQTKYGLTRKIKIRDSIRQGGVLSGIMYGAQMDEVNKDIKLHKQEILNKSPANGVLLWVDDVLETNTNKKDLQEMLKITEETSDKYRIFYGESKSNILKVGTNQKEELNMSIAQIKPLKRVNKYTYLGHQQNSKNNLQDQIKEIKGKLEAIYQTIIQVTTDETLERIEMKTIFSYINYNIIPTITSTAEAWQPTKKEWNELNTLYEKMLKRILKIPGTTPKESIYIETGLMDPETIIKRNKVNKEVQMKKGKNEHLKNRILNNPIKNGWKEKTELIKKELSIEEQDLEGSKAQTKFKVKKKARNYFRNKINTSGTDKSKVKYLKEGLEKDWQPGKKQKYLEILTRKQTTSLFKARNRMLDVKNNFRGKHKDMKCRLCEKENETQEHILEECQIIQEKIEKKITKADLFQEDETRIKETAKKLIEIETILDELNKQEKTTTATENDTNDTTKIAKKQRKNNKENNNVTKNSNNNKERENRTKTTKKRKIAKNQANNETHTPVE